MAAGSGQGGIKGDSSLEIVLAGDLVLDEPEADYWLSGISPALRAADLAIGHLETPYTDRAAEMEADVPAPGAPPANLRALVLAGFDMVTLAGNHVADCGPAGIEDTLQGLDAIGLAHAGAGATLSLARAPAIVERNGRRIAVLSYNCVGPEATWAGPDRPGCAWLRVETADGSPIAPAAPLERPAPEALEALVQDVGQARRAADLVLVALHKGIVHTPAQLAPYERPLAQAAIDAGADAVIGHHAHIIRGVEFHRGRPIFHGLGNGCVVTRALSPSQDHPKRRAWAERRKQLFGFEPDPDYILAPFHPQAVNAMLGRLVWDGAGALSVGIIPVHVEPPGRPVLADGDRAAQIRAYLEQITLAAGLAPISVGTDGMVQAGASQ